MKGRIQCQKVPERAEETAAYGNSRIKSIVGMKNNKYLSKYYIYDDVSENFHPPNYFIVVEHLLVKNEFFKTNNIYC